MTQGTHWLRSAWLALLALALLSGGSFAAGDLFDDDYHDCPAKTRLRDGQIADLTLARDAEEEDHVNVAWEATDPATWGLGANAYHTSLVLLLDDGGDLASKTLSLGTRKATFSGVAPGKNVKVQMAIVVDAAEGDYLISDILEASVHQSLTAPSFSTGWIIEDLHPVLVSVPNFPKPGDFPMPDLGRLYYIGYNANFGNYRAGADLTFSTYPSTPSLRIGLAHGGEDDDAREDVKFDAYVIRLMGEDGDVVPEGDDVRTVVSNYGQGYQSALTPDGNIGGYFDKQLVVNLDRSSSGYDPATLVARTPAGVAVRALLDSHGPIVNVRINDGGTITPPMNRNPLLRWMTPDQPPGLIPPHSPLSTVVALSIGVPEMGTVYARPPDAHRDFPIDVLASDRTYTIEAWAVNEDRAVLSPKATLKVHPRAQAPTTLTSGAGSFQDYLNSTSPTTSGTLLTTEFTVLK